MSSVRDWRRFPDKVVLVTGGSRGIGAGCVRLFYEHGANVAFCSNKKEEGEALEKELNESRSVDAKNRALFVFCELTDHSQVEHMVTHVVQEFGGQIDCLINNAGYHPDHRPIDDFSAEEFQSLLNLNVVSPFYLCKLCLPYLRKTQGSVINISSMVSWLGQQGAATYVATKGAMNGLTKALAVDEAKYNVRVNSVLPSNIDTPMMHSCLSAQGDPLEKALQACASLQLLGCLGESMDVAHACLYLASEGTFVTGIELPVSGGSELNYGVKTRKSTKD